MYHNIHSKFILIPIFNILEEAADVCQVMGNGIETQPLCEYVMQSTFLKMTGALEQKMKCICWEIATNDYEYRYNLLQNNKKSSEYSKYEAKQKVFNDLLNQIRKQEEDFDTRSIIKSEKYTTPPDKVQSWIDDMTKKVFSMLERTTMRFWLPREFNEMRLHAGQLNSRQLFQNGSLFGNELQKDYKTVVYDHRNRCAHNLKSYQENLPKLNTLTNETYLYENYFYRYILLIVLDEIFILLFQKYLDTRLTMWQ